jgi:hypothetical protein
MAELKLDLPTSEYANLIGGLLLGLIRCEYTMLSLLASRTAEQLPELPGHVQLGLAQIATDHALQAFAPHLREKFASVRDELAAAWAWRRVLRPRLGLDPWRTRR